MLSSAGKKPEQSNIVFLAIYVKVSYTNIRTVNDDQELLLNVYTINVAPEQNPDVNGIENDFSKWFSFVISSRGVVNHVFHPRREDEEVVAIKKGLASIFAAKLHEEGEVPGTNDSNGFTYNVSELGGEGEHNSTYIVSLTKEGIEFKKTRHNHPVKNAKASYLKTMVYHDYLRTIHSVLIEDNFTSPKTPHGFNPLHGMRKVKAVNEFSTTEYPSMSYTSRGKLTFISRHEHKKEWLKPTEHLMKAPIQIGKVKHIPKHLNFTEIRKNIATNLTCIENQPEQGSPGTAVCFLNIVNQLKKLPDKEVERLAHFYFDILQTTTDKYKKAKENMVDAFGAMSTDLSERILAEKIMLSSSPDANLVKRILTHVATNDKIPSEVMMKALEDAVFHQEKYPAAFYAKDTHSRCMLALGAVSHKLMKEGKAEKARKIINKIHANLGLHDPWEYRVKRAAMTTREKEEYDLNKVILLETLGNARLDESYDFILSHINSTNSPWIKRAGCHALRHFDHEHAANTLLYAALYDEDQSVRYEASLLYMAHPKGKMIAPMNVRETTVFDNYTMMEYPYDNGVDVIGLTSSHQRSRRSVWDGLKFRLEAPSVDWRKHIGTTDIGASFGVIMMNLLDLAIAPTQGHLKVRVHDEAYARVHVGILGVNFDFFVARVCFKGGTEYNINILQGNEMKKIIDMASNFSKKLKEIVEGIIAGVDLFRRLISGNISLKKIVDDLVMAVTSIPQKVSNLVEKASQALAVIGQYDPEDLPPEFKATINFVHKVSKLFSDIKVDVMGFVNAVEQSINVVIPHQVNAIYESIKDIINGFSKILKNPKEALGNIGKGVFTYETDFVFIGSSMLGYGKMQPS
uniref:Vitellogenin domain-containing protein n=1 Tax=Magallana gigas TaxID=29159 RepID=A0A8W8J8B9_MAGGI